METQACHGAKAVGGEDSSDKEVKSDDHNVSSLVPGGPSMEHTELIKVSPDKHKYVNTCFTKVQAKMYDYNCDVKLRVGSETFRAHRSVLSDASDYFSAMFSHDMREREQDAVELLGISPQGFTAMLEYFYHGHVTIIPENIEDIIEASRFFMIEWMLKVCCDFLVRHLSLENYDNVLTLADKYVLGDLRFAIFKFIGSNFNTLAEQGKFLHLSYDLFYLLLAEDYAIEAPELAIFRTVLDWVEHNPEERKKHMVDMLLLIRFPLFEPEELKLVPPDVLAVPQLKELVDEAQTYHDSLHHQCLLTTERTELRGAQDVVMAISAIEDANFIQYKSPGLPGYFSEEVSTQFLQSLFEFSQLLTLGNFVYVAGGYDRNTWCSSPAFYRYNPRNREWVELTPMEQPRVSFGFCASDRGLFALAGIDHVVEEGRDTEIILPSNEFYDPEFGTWTPLPSLPHGCFSAAAAFARGTVFLSGGINDDPEDNVPVNYLRSYVPGQHSWVNMAPMLTERQGHAMTAVGNDKLFALGGYHSSAATLSFEHCLRVESYDVELNQWTQLREVNPEMQHIHASTAVLDDRLIYIIGGKHASRMLAIFDTEKGEVVEVEYCGEHVLRLAAVRIALPEAIE